MLRFWNPTGVNGVVCGDGALIAWHFIVGILAISYQLSAISYQCSTLSRVMSVQHSSSSRSSSNSGLF